MKKISIIIPCYNAEKYISMCIESLTKQSIGIENLELIFVNDASTDDTLSILYEWEKKHSESILIVNCKQNGKQGRARNIGLSYATSEYVGFMDDDDLIEPYMYEKLYEKAKTYDCDLVVCRNKTHTLEQMLTVQMGRTKDEDSCFTIQNETDRIRFLQTDVNFAVWNKIYRKTVIEKNNIFFPEGYIYDDIFFSELIKHYVKKVYILEEWLYHHIKRSNASSYDTEDIQIRLGFIEIQQMKIRELRNRGIYNKYAKRYEKEYMIDYITLFHNLLKTYSYIPPHILNDVKKRTMELFPNYMENPLVIRLLKGEGGLFYQAICEGLSMEIIDEEYVQRLIHSFKR